MKKIEQALFPMVLTVVSIALALAAVGCQKNGTQETTTQSQPAQTDQSQSQDPAAAANLAPAADTTKPSATTEQQPAPQQTQQNAQPAPDQNYSDNNYDSDSDSEDSSYGQPVLQASDPPPPLPEYSQPDCPGDGYLWTPGYWSYAPQGYYWVPGAWARPPEAGFLWTPGYWGFAGGRYRYHYGFWGRHIGYYGGIDYGFGYVGAGYQGGYWNGNRFQYNRFVNNVSNVTNIQIYNRTVTNNRSSFNGPGGVTRQPLPAEIAATREQRVPPMTTQLEARQVASQNRQ